PLTFRHWAGVSPYTSPFGFAETCVFGKQSFGLFRCGLAVLKDAGSSHTTRHSFSGSYGVVLPSSLTGVLSRALGFSPCLPVSVCGTGTGHLARGFSRQCGIGPFATLISLPITSRI